MTLQEPGFVDCSPKMQNHPSWPSRVNDPPRELPEPGETPFQSHTPAWWSHRVGSVMSRLISPVGGVPESLKYGTNELIYKTETDLQRTDLWLPRRGGRRSGKERGGLGIWCASMQTVAFRMDKQGPTGQHGELYLISWDKP